MKLYSRDNKGNKIPPIESNMSMSIGTGAGDWFNTQAHIKGVWYHNVQW